MDSTAHSAHLEVSFPVPGVLAGVSRANKPVASNHTAGSGKVCLNREQLVALRQSLLLSQEELAVLCWQRKLRLSIATLKRAETGRPVLFRTARELARLYGVPVRTLFC